MMDNRTEPRQTGSSRPDDDSESLLRQRIRRHKRTPTAILARLEDQFTLASRWLDQGDYRRAGLLLALNLGALESLGSTVEPPTDSPDASHDLLDPPGGQPGTAEARRQQAAEIEAAVCNLIGVVGKYTGQFVRAERAYLRALDILRSAHGEWHDSVATIYHNLGGLAHARGDHVSGEPWARRAVDLRLHLHGPDSVLVAADRGAWAALLDGLGRYDEAEARLREALEVFRRTYGECHYEIAVTVHNLASLRHRRGRTAEAIEGYRHALELKQRLLGLDHPDLAPTLVNLAVAYREHDQSAIAQQLSGRAIAILASHVESDHPTLAAAFECHARDLDEVADYPEGPACRAGNTDLETVPEAAR